VASTGNIFIDTLAGVSWLDVGGDRNITYYFDETLTHRPWTPFEMAMWENSLQQWANVANITTQSVSSQAGADLIETWQTFLYMQDHHGGNIPSYHDLPNASGHAVGEFNTQGRFTYFSLTGMDIGGQGFSIFLETICHALGLDANYLRQGLERWKVRRAEGRAHIYRFRRVNGRRTSVVAPRAYSERSTTYDERRAS